MTDYRDGLADLFLLGEARTRSISAENPTGAPGAGGRAESSLGPGRKGRPCIDLPPGSTTTLAEIAGPGVIQHLWLTVPDRTDQGEFVLRDLVLRIYWDGEDTPSVEVPLGDFFCNGFGLRANVASLPVAVNPWGGFSCYLPMPFAGRARVTIENQHPGEVRGMYYQITYAETDALPLGSAGFHAQWRRESPTTPERDFTILDGVKGRGHYVGTYPAWAALAKHWWGEGEIKFYLDGDGEFPTICGTGTEDYAGGAWCFSGNTIGTPESYTTPFLGYRYHGMQGKTPGLIRHDRFLAWPLPLARHGPDPVRRRYQGNDPTDRSRWSKLFRTRRRCGLGRLLVPNRAARPLSPAAGGAAEKAVVSTMIALSGIGRRLPRVPPRPLSLWGGLCHKRRSRPAALHLAARRPAPFPAGLRR